MTEPAHQKDGGELVLMRPEPDESQQEFSARLLAAMRKAGLLPEEDEQQS